MIRPQPIIRCQAYGCEYATTSRISMGMHRSFKHNSNSKYRRWLAKQKAAKESRS